MEVGRLGVKFGIEPPTLIKLEMSLEDPLPPPVKGASTLDEKVLHVPHTGPLRFSPHLELLGGSSSSAATTPRFLHCCSTSS